MATSALPPAVNQNDHVAAAAYLLKHAGATALVVLDGQWPPGALRYPVWARIRTRRRSVACGLP
jgi:hypothetical protein